MGWCSATSIFDGVVKTTLNLPISKISKKAIIKELMVRLEDHDWDCQYDSDFFQDPLVWEVISELHPDWEPYDE